MERPPSSSAPAAVAGEAEFAEAQRTHKIPAAAWKRRLDERLAQMPQQFSLSWMKLMGLGWRMTSYVKREKEAGREPFMDPMNPIAVKDDQGVPLGGIGAGSITRGWRGDFVRWNLRPGRPEYTSPVEDGFALFVKDQSTGIKRAVTLNRHPRTGVSGAHSAYYALFPRAWSVYEEPDPQLRVVCRQVSPVIAHNYEASSFPVAVFVYSLENKDTTAKTVSLLFRMRNGTGGASDVAGGHYNRAFDEGDLRGVQLRHKQRLLTPTDAGHREQYEDVLVLGMAVQAQEGVFVTRRSAYDSTPVGNNDANDGGVWKEFSTDGQLEGSDENRIPYSAQGRTVAAAIAAKTLVQPGEKREVVFLLAWDAPVVRFGKGQGHYRRYTRFFGNDGNQIQALLATAKSKWREWEAAIEAWQAPTLMDANLPLWFRGTLFNELYYLVDGGSLWTHGEETDAERAKKRALPPTVAAATRAASTGNLASEKASAQRVLDSYLEFVNSDKLAEIGVQVTRQGQPNSGRVLFSLRDLPLRTPYVTAQGVVMERISADTVLLNGTVRLHVFDPRQPVAALPRDSSLSDIERIDRSSTSSIGEKAKDAVTGTAGADTRPGSPQAARSQRAGALTEQYGRFAYLESHEYLMYNTYDVHFYASFALAMLWPHLELSLQRDVTRAALAQYSEKWQIMGTGELGYRKLRGAVPHDLGTPGEEPWARVNAYNVQDVSNWKDLNSKFVLQIYRDWIATGDDDFLQDSWEVVKELMHFLSLYDKNSDCMIENEGFPDQTYDAWSVTGVSAYSGGLWLAALHATAHMAEVIAESKAAGYYRSVLAQAQRVYEAKLWTGSYYKYDEGVDGSSLSIMADQMCGQWYARACGLPPLHPEANVQAALQTVYKNNVMKFRGGQAGAVNGMWPDGRVDESSMQSCEVWTGTSYAVAAAMLQEGMVQEAWQTAYGVHRVTYEHGYWFQTPEAWDGSLRYRAIAYMRPLSIWALKWAWERRAERASALLEKAQLAFSYRKDERKLRAKGERGRKDEKKRKKLQDRLVSTRTLLERYESDPDFRSDSSGRDDSENSKSEKSSKAPDTKPTPPDPVSPISPAGLSLSTDAALPALSTPITELPVTAILSAVPPLPLATAAPALSIEAGSVYVAPPASPVPDLPDEKADSANSSFKDDDSYKEKK